MITCIVHCARLINTHHWYCSQSENTPPHTHTLAHSAHTWCSRRPPGGCWGRGPPTWCWCSSWGRWPAWRSRGRQVSSSRSQRPTRSCGIQREGKGLSIPCSFFFTFEKLRYQSQIDLECLQLFPIWFSFQYQYHLIIIIILLPSIKMTQINREAIDFEECSFDAIVLLL